MTNEEAIKQLEWVKKRISKITYSPESFEALNKAIKALRNEPFLIDALHKAHAEIKEMERPQGEWIKKVDDVGFVSYICSECGFELELEDCSDSYYCSNCGADMREADKEVTNG